MPGSGATLLPRCGRSTPDGEPRSRTCYDAGVSRHPTTFLPMAAGYASLVGHHRHLLDDAVRTRAFLRAVARVVRPGDTVVDLGTGTGILAIAARRAGARAVWAIDHDPIVKVAAAIARDNAVEGITFVEQHSRDFVTPVDVVISECFGPFAIGGSMIPAVIDLRRRAGKPGVRVIPRGVTLYLAPVESPAAWAHVAAFARSRYGLAWKAAQQLATHNVYNTVITPRMLVAPGAAIHAIDLERGAWTGKVTGTATWTARRAARMHGFAGWFVADLGEGVTLSTAPGKPETIWRQVLFPLPEPMRIARGGAIDLAFECLAGEDFDWLGMIGGRAFKCSTRYSHPS